MARAAVIPQSPPKRATRTRTKGTTTTTTASSRTAPKTTKAKAPSSATEARKRGVRTASVTTTTTTTTTKRPVDEEDADATTDDEIDMFAGSKRGKGTATAKPKGRPPAAKAGASTVAARTRKTPVVATPPAAAESDSDNDDELAQSEVVPKKRAGRPKAKPAAAAVTKEADKPAAAPKTRGRPKGTAAAKPKVVDELKENTRLNAKGFTDIDFSSSQEAPRQVYITTHSSSVRSNMLRGPAKKKKVTFQDPTDTDADELNEPSPPPAGRRRGAASASGRQGGLASKPVRKPAATSGRCRKPAAAKKDDSSKPLSPKKATQVAKGLSSYASSDGEDDELSADKDQMKAILQSPPKHGSEKIGLSSPVKKINLTGRHFRKSLDENGEPLPGPRRSVDFNDNNLLLSSPARRPPPSPFNFTMRETPRRGGGLTLRSDINPLSQPTLSPTLNSPLRLSPKKASLETPRRGNLFGTSTGSVSQPNFTPGRNSPLKSSPRKGLFGASFMSQPQPEPSATPLRHSTSLLQSPAKKVATPFKASLSVMKSPVPEESEHEDDNEEEPGENDTLDDSHLEESPLRLMQTRVETQADEENEATQDVASEENDELDPVSTTPPHSPSVARHYENSAANGETAEHDSEETVEYVDDDASTIAEDVAEVVGENVEEEGDQSEDQAMEDDAGSMAEESDIDDMEEVDPPPEYVDVSMEETGEEVTQGAAEEFEENQNAEPSEDVNDENVEKLNEGSLGEPVAEDIPESQHHADKERDDLQVGIESDDDAEEHNDDFVVREISVDATLDDASDGDNQDQNDDRVNLDQDMPDTVSDAEDDHQDAIGQERAATPGSAVEEEIDQPTTEEQHTPIPNIRNSLAKDLSDVFVEEPTLPAQADQRLDSSDTEDDPDMMETDEDVDAAEEDLSRSQQEDIVEDSVFEENEPTIVVAEPTEIVPRSRVPILPYEVEEPENPWSPIREAYYRAMKNISPVRVLPDSPVRRNMSFESTADSPSPIRQGFTVDTSGNQDPFVDSNSATPLLRRSIKRSIFDNAPRFTPLAQQFSQWKASSPARSQPRRSQRPRKGIFSLGGSRRSSSNILPTPEKVTYPQIDSQAEDAVSEKPAQSEAAEADAEIVEDDDPQSHEDVSHSVQSEVIDASETTEAEPEVADENVDPQNYEESSQDSQVEDTEAAEAVESADTAEQDTEATEGPEDYEDFSRTPAFEEPGTTEDAEQMSEEDESEIYEGLSQSPRPSGTNNTETTEPAEPVEQTTEVIDGPQISEDLNQQSQAEEIILAETEEPVTQEVDGPQIYEDPSQDSLLEAYPSEDIQETEGPVVDMPNGTEVKSALDNYTEEVPSEELVTEIASASKSPVSAIDAFDDDKENEVFSNIPLFTPVKNRIPQMQTVHTVSKVPLKPEGQISPLKISRKRGLSLSGASPIRASTRIRTSTFAPTQQTVPPLSPRKSPRLQRVSMSRPVAPVTHPAESKNERSTPAKRPPQSPSPTKSAKVPRRSMSAPAPKLALQGAVVYVDVHTTEGEDASGIFIELLQQMGARCIKNWCWNPRASLAPEEGVEPKEGKVGVTHVVFKDGSARTLEKIRHARGLVKCVGVGWVLDCERENKWLDETPYTVDSSIVPRGGAKRRKSMEPRALSNVNGTLVRATATATAMDRRRSGAISRDTVESFTRDHSTPPLSTREEEQAESSTATPPDQVEYTVGHTEPDQRYCHTPQTPGSSAYAFDMDAIGMSPTTPFYLSQRTKLVQQTCPPKQTRQGLFNTPGPVREPNQKLRSKLEAARRKSMAYKPRVGSPLVE